MRLAKKWLIGGTIAAAATAGAVAVAVPAVAQQSGGQHHTPAVHVSPVCTVSGVPKFTTATAVPVAGKPVTVGPAGKTAAPPVTVTLVPVPGKPHGPVIMATGKPVNVKPVTTCPGATTDLPPSSTTPKPLR
jgi:hypothetical protein